MHSIKQDLIKYIEDNSSEYIQLADDIFDDPELGLQERRALDKITNILKKNGFFVQSNVYGFETAFKAVYKCGNGGYSVGLLCEYDALEGLGHGCAHHMQAPSILLAAIALKNILCNFDFNIVVYGTPAEETLGAKVPMLKNGAFQDIDIALMMHGADKTTTDVKSLALSNFEVEFFGKNAHAALAPHEGRSALDALLLCFNGIEFLREHVKDDVRIHYNILESGKGANIVPKYAKAIFSLRSYDRVYLDSVIERFKNIIKGASLMSECDHKIVLIKSLNNKIPVISLNNILMQNAKILNAPNIAPPREKTGSTDFGSVMYEVPGTCIRVSFVKEGTSSHSDEFIKMGKSKSAHEAIICASKIVSASVYDLITDKSLAKSVKDEFLLNKSSN